MATIPTLALNIGWGTTLAIKTIVVLTVIPLGAIVLGYVFLMKMMSHMQSRLGPMDPGGFHGWYQLVGDGLKFLQKEDIMPAESDRRVFAAAPAVVVMSTFLVFLVIPMGPDLVVKNLDVGVFYALAVILQGIVFSQQRGSVFGWGGLGEPFVLTQFIGFALFLVASQAELTQTPFDMPVAESELVAGYMVEYTGFRFLFFFIGEFGTAFAFSAIAATLFLGGWAIPGVHGDLANILGPVVLFTKIMLVAFLMFWARFTYPRFREDQLQALAWKWLIPIALGNILLTGIL